MHEMFFFSCNVGYCPKMCCHNLKNVSYAFIGRAYKVWETNMFAIMCLEQTKKIEIKLTQNNVL
jgi:hypothetical protein